MKNSASLRKLLATLSLCLSAAAILAYVNTGYAVTPAPQRFSFALIGDMPYGFEFEMEKFANLKQDLEQRPLAFVVHNGDIGAPPCADEFFRGRFDLFNAFAHPFVLILGDNEWTDCHLPAFGSYDPLERLVKVREIFTADNQSLGQRKIRLKRQSDEDTEYSAYRENVRWSYGGVVFIGLHVVGSNNNLGRTAQMDAEYADRNAANLAWLKTGFDKAVEFNARGVLVILQAAMPMETPKTHPARAAFGDVLRALEEETIRFNKPVALIHGDDHVFRISKPLVDYSYTGKRVENFTRVGTFGAPNVHWVRGTIDSADPDVFSFKPEIVDENTLDAVQPFPTQ